MDALRDYLEKTLSLELPEGWSERIDRFHALLIEANVRCNLTRLTSRDDFLYKHVADSLLVCQVWPAIRNDGLRVADIGCGGGIPGIPLALTFPALRVTEVDSSRKKVSCVREFIEALGLSDCDAIAVRARELAHRESFQGAFDLVVARAVDRTSKLIRECRRLLAPGGALISYKTPDQVREDATAVAREAAKADLQTRASPTLPLPGGRGERQFVVVARQES